MIGKANSINLVIEIPQYVLVTPVWNDSARLKVYGQELAKALKESGLSVKWVIADDGSSVRERELLAGLLNKFTEIYPHVQLIHCAERTRKGGAVRVGWDAYPEAEFYCFVDGDGAISADVMLGLMRDAGECLKDYVSVVGVRQTSSPENEVNRTWLRNALFRGFSMFMHLLLKEPWLDTQCGAKVINGGAYRSIRDSLQETGFVFDAELLTYLSHSGYTVKEVPISWREVPGSKLSLFADSWRILMGLVRIRSRLGRH